MPDCKDVEREMTALVERRQAQTSAGRAAFASRFASDDERRAHMRELALKSAQTRRQARLERLRAEALEILSRRTA